MKINFPVINKKVSVVSGMPNANYGNECPSIIITGECLGYLVNVVIPFVYNESAETAMKELALLVDEEEE